MLKSLCAALVISLCSTSFALSTQVFKGFVKLENGKNLYVEFEPGPQGSPTLILMNGLTNSTENWNKMMPFKLNSQKRMKTDTDIIWIWVKVVIACVPGAVVTIFFDHYVEKHLHTPLIIASTLIFYGIAFILVENWNKYRTFKIQHIKEISYRGALGIGLFQVLSIIPGTSRSGATIIGALLMGVSREAAAEFTFFLAVPVMFGLSALKIIKFGFAFSGLELLVLSVGMIVAFAVSVFVVKFLMSYIKKHDFKVFGWYRIVLGLLVVIYFLR